MMGAFLFLHRSFKSDPQFGIHRLVRLMKGCSSRLLRQEFPGLKRKLPTLWTNRYFVSMVEGAPLSVMKQYIENQRQFQQICESKAACAGSRVLFVSPKYTSQMCSGCGAIVKKELEERWHECACGCSLDRDYNAAINILRLGLQVVKREPVLGRSAQRTRL